MSSDDRDAMDAALLDLWIKSLPKMLERVRVMELAVVALRVGRLDAVDRANAERAAHKIAGVAGTFGFWDATELAREAEAAFTGTDPISTETTKHLSEIASQLWKQWSCDVEVEAAER